MTKEEAISIIRRIQEPEAWEPQLNSAAFEALEMAIEALNLQPTCNQLATDCISRQDAIDILDAYQVMVDNGEEKPYAWASLRMSELPSAQPKQVYVATVTLTDEQLKEAVEKAKNAVISVIEPVPQWMPCSEGLPEESGRYFVTPDCIYNAVRIDYFRPEFGWENGEKYTAWMPLPEPYKAKEEL